MSALTHTSSIAQGMRLCAYFDEVAHLARVGIGSPPRRARDPRIQVVGMHLAAVHSMPLHRIAELVALTIARRARNGVQAARRVTRHTRARRTTSQRAQR